MRKIARRQNIMAFVMLFLVAAGVFLLAQESFYTRIALPIPLMPVLLALLITCLVMVIGGILTLGGLASYIVHRLTHPQRRAAQYPDLGQTLNLPAEHVSFSPLQGHHSVHGFYIPCKGATTTIVLSPGYRRGLKDIMSIGKHLWEAGHQVLVFEYHGHGSMIGGPITLGYRELNDFLGAIAYVKLRDPHTHVGAIGYSMGAAVTLLGAAQTQEVEAVIADSAFASSWSPVELALHRTFRLRSPLPGWLLTLLYAFTDRLLWWRAGYHFHQVYPSREVAKIAPRPLLFIHGTNDTVVNPGDATHLYEAALFPKYLWLIKGAGHVKGHLVDRQAYIEQVLNFFAWTLPVARKGQRPRRILENQHHSLSSSDGFNEMKGQEQQKYAVEREAVGAGQETVKMLQSAERREAPLPGFHTPRREKRHSDKKQYSALGQAYGRLVYRWRWPIVVMWGVILLAAVPFAAALPSVLHNRGYTISTSESVQVSTMLTTTFHQPTTQVLVVFQSADIPVTDRAYQQELSDFLKHVKTFPHVTSATQGKIGQDLHTTYVVLGFDQDQDTVAGSIPDLRHLLTTTVTGPARAFLTGEPAVDSEIQLDTASNTEYAEIIAMPATLLVLLLVFGTTVSAALPLLLAAGAVVTALATLYLVALHIETNIFVQSIASIIGLGLSIDYSLILLYRFREELARQETVREAVAITVATAGEAILFSGMTVAIGFAGLLLMGIQVMTSFGLGGIIIASTAVLAALTLLPALFSILGTRVNALSLSRILPWKARQKNRGVQGRFWLWWARIIQRRALVIIGLVLLLLLTFGWPALALNPALPGITALPASSEARQGLDILHSRFPDLNDNPLTLIAQTADGSSPLTDKNLARLDALTGWIESQAHVTEVVSLTRPPKEPGRPALSWPQLQQLYRSNLAQSAPDLKAFVDATTVGNATLIVVKSDTLAGSSADQSLIDHLRAIEPGVKQGLLVLVGGTRVLNLDFNRTLYQNFVRAFVFILLATYCLLFFTFKSIFLPLKAILMNVLSVAAAYGILVWVFQQGHLQNLLDFQSDGFIDRFVPLILFCTLFGLSMDYEVFLLSRVREEWLHTRQNNRSVAIGLQKTGGVITSAAVLFALVSGSFLFTSLTVTKELGLGITVSLLVDATIIRALLVPATMHVLGRWNWWMPDIGKLLKKRDHSKDHGAAFVQQGSALPIGVSDIPTQPLLLEQSVDPSLRVRVLACGHTWHPHMNFCPVCGRSVVDLFRGTIID